MSTPAELTRAVSDPTSERYDPESPHYDVTVDPSSPFYVGPIEDHARSGDDIRAEVTAHVQEALGVSELTEKQRDAIIQTLYTANIWREESGLDQGLELRQPGAAPRTVWHNASHEQMIDTLTSNADSAAVAETSEEWIRLGNELTLHQRAIADAIDDSMGDWQGEGGDAARRHLAEVAKWLGTTAQGAVLTGRQQQIHSQTLNETQKQMDANPPVHFSAAEANASLQQIADPVAYAATAQQMIRTMQAQQAARDQAARIMTQFDDTVGSATDLPLFSPPPKLADVQPQGLRRVTPAGGGAGAAGAGMPDPAVTMGGDGAAGGGAAGLGGVPGADGPGAPGGFGGGGSNPDPASPGTELPAADAGHGAPQVSVPGLPGPGGPGQGVPFSAPTPGPGGDLPGVPPSIPVPDVPTPGHGPSGFTSDGPNVSRVPMPDLGNPPGVDDSTTTSSYTPADPTLPGTGKLGWPGGVNGDSIANRLAGGGPGSGGGSFGGALPNTAGMGGAAGLAGGGGAAGGGSRVSGGASTGAVKGPLGEGLPMGPGPGVAGPGGRGGMPGAMAPGMVPAAGAGKKGEDDTEHRVAGYLSDDEDIFATETPIAPPVIGDWKNNKNADWK